MTAPSRPRIAVLLALSVASAVLLAGCGTDGGSSAADPAPSTKHPVRPTQQDSPSDDPTATSSTSGGASDTVAVPLYFVGDTPQGPRLYREFQQVDPADPVDEALAILAAGTADDPDYRSLLPDGKPTLVQGDNSTAIGVNVPVDWASRPSGMSSKDAGLAIQQIVFTVQGALQSQAPVEFYSDGLTPMFGVDKSTFKPSEDALALVNITQPQQDSEPGATFTASGVANSFESNVPWQVLDSNGNRVLDGHATAEGFGDKLYPWQTQVDCSALPAGTYTFVASTDDASGGEGGGPTKDTKTFTLH